MSLNDVQLLLADVAIIIILARLLGTAARRLGQPPVLGEILIRGREQAAVSVSIGSVALPLALGSAA
jgi:hypothetical protein